MAEETKEVLYSYIVTRNTDGSVDVADNSSAHKGAEEINNDKIYEDIENVARLVALKRTSDTAFAAAYNGVAKFYQDVNRQQTAAAAPEEPATEEK